MNKLGNNERRMHTTLEVGTVDEGEKINNVDEDQPMRVPTMLRRHSTSMPIGATLLSPTSTYPLTTHKHSGTMRISLIEEEHNKFKDLDSICNNNKHDREQKIGAEKI